MGFLEYLKTGQLYQFALTVFVLIFYAISMFRGSPDDTLKSILLVVVSYWFVSAITKPAVDNITTKIQTLDDTIKSQVVTNQQVTNQQVDKQTLG